MSEAEVELTIVYLRQTLHLDEEAIEEFRQCAQDAREFTLPAITAAMERRRRMVQLRAVGGDLTMLPPAL